LHFQRQLNSGEFSLFYQCWPNSPGCSFFNRAEIARIALRPRQGLEGAGPDGSMAYPAPHKPIPLRKPGKSDTDRRHARANRGKPGAFFGFERFMVYTLLGHSFVAIPFGNFWSLPVEFVSSAPVRFRQDGIAEQDLEKHIHVRTGRRVRNLVVELRPERVILRGLAESYYVKQLAQEGIRDLLPQATLHNAISVTRPA
jgi:hypothetical protein